MIENTIGKIIAVAIRVRGKSAVMLYSIQAAVETTDSPEIIKVFKLII